MLQQKSSKRRTNKMALFGKSPYEKLKDLYASLKDEDKEKFKAELLDVDKAEDEREVDKIEEEKADNDEVKDEKKEEVEEESEEIGEKIDDAEELGEKDETAEEAEPEEAPKDDKGVEEAVEEAEGEDGLVEEKETEEKHEDILEGFEARLKALEEKMLSLAEEKPTEDVGVSGFGKTIKEDIDDDRRNDDVIKKLGGYAH